MKAARVYTQLNKHDEALRIYKRIKSEYPLSQEGMDADKYIEKAKLN